MEPADHTELPTDVAELECFIDKLPTEIILKISENLCPHCCSLPTERSKLSLKDNKKTLLSFILTNKSHCTIGEQVYYHDATPKNMVMFLHRIIARPDLATKVRRLTTDMVEMEIIGDDDVKIFQAEASRLNFGDWGNGQGALPDSDITQYYLLLELTLALIPNVEELKLWVPYKHSRYQLDQLFKAPLTLNPVTYLSFTTTGDPIDLAKTVNLLDKLPHLRKLEMNACGSATQSLPLGELRSLVITESNLTEASLRTIVDSCPKLEHFEYNNLHYDPQPVFGIEQRECTWGQALAILSSRKTTLKHLNLSFDRGSNFHVSPTAEDFLMSFHDFTVLETLWVRTTSFGTTDLGHLFPSFPENVNDLVAKLPASLTCLGFVGFHDHWDGIEKLATAIKAGHFKNLKTVLVEEEDEEFVNSHAELRALGVTFEIISEPLTMEEYLRDTLEIFL